MRIFCLSTLLMLIKIFSGLIFSGVFPEYCETSSKVWAAHLALSRSHFSRCELCLDLAPLGFYSNSPFSRAPGPQCSISYLFTITSIPRRFDICMIRTEKFIIVIRKFLFVRITNIVVCNVEISAPNMWTKYLKVILTVQNGQCSVRTANKTM